TEQIQLRAGSVVAPLHHPVRIAEDWMMVDNLSQGRIGISFASGWNPDDFTFFPERYQDRHEAMYRAIKTVRYLWQGGSLQATAGDGQPTTIKPALTPVQPLLPIWLTAAGNPETFRRAGEIGANLLTHMFNQSLEQLAENIAIYREARASYGHDIRTGQVTVTLHTFVGQAIDQVRDQARKPYCEFVKSNMGLFKGLASARGHHIDLEALSTQEIDEFANFIYDRFATTRGLIGTPESCLDLLTNLEAIGVTEIASLLDFGLPQDQILTHLPDLNQLRETFTQLSSNRQPVKPYIAPLTDRSQQRPPAMTFENLAENDSLSAIQARCVNVLSQADFYQQLQARGLHLDKIFQGVQQLWRGQAEALGVVQLLPELRVASSSGYTIHPALLDACFQVLVAALPLEATQHSNEAFLPAGFQKMAVYGEFGDKIWSHARLRHQIGETTNTLSGDLQFFDDNGTLIAKVTGLQIQRLQAENTPPEWQDWLYQLQWRPQPVAPVSTQRPAGCWILFADRQGVAQAFANRLTEMGHHCFFITSEAPTTGNNWFTVNPAESNEMYRCLEQILNQTSLPLQGVVHFWSLGVASQAPEITLDDLAANHHQTIASALHLIQALDQLKVTSKVWWVTQSAQPVEMSIASSALKQTPLWGFGRVVAAEYPHLWGGLVDLDGEIIPGNVVQQ
ncbi:MAG: MupA/Atu3671 family FMN-dependent luciferase-like monooxygenase, partial [Chloroflexota bacterium]